MKTLKFILFFNFALLQFLRANDTDLGNYGYTPVSMSESKVQMLKEIIYIKVYANKYKVHCKFWFFNHGNKIKLKVGFPDFIFNGYYGENYQPIRNFKSLVNDKPVELEYSSIKRIDTNLIENRSVFDTINNKWYIKAVEFPEKDTVIIENYYEGKPGTTIAHGFSALEIFSYVIGTGSSWYGNILDGLIVFDYTNQRSSDFIRNQNKIINIEHIKTSISENITTFEFKDYKPKNNQALSLEFYKYFYLDLSLKNSYKTLLPNPDFYDNINYLDEIKENFNKEKLERMSREVLAREGYHFKNKNDNIFFKQKTWYKPSKENNKSTKIDNAIDESQRILYLRRFVKKNKEIFMNKNINEQAILKQMEIFKLSE